MQKAIARSGLMSRRAAEEAIIAGRVLVNGESVVLGDRLDVAEDTVTIDGVPTPIDPDLQTYLLYKPVGVISTADDPRGRTTVVELIDSPARLYPVGRLDADSEGLILVSNDGELTNRVTHPRFGITKTYLAMVEGMPDSTAIRRLVEGVELEDGLARARSARLVDTHGHRALVEMVMLEGRNREVRRMLEQIGFPVTRLVRTAIGPLTDPDLAPGGSRLLTASEIRRLLESGAG